MSPNPSLMKVLFPRLVKNFAAIQVTNYDPHIGLYFNTDNRDGMESSIGGDSGRKGYRPTLNSYQYGEAITLSRLSLSLFGEEGRNKSQSFASFAAYLRGNILRHLWDNEAQFFKVLPASPSSSKRNNVPVAAVTPTATATFTSPTSTPRVNSFTKTSLVDVRELHGFSLPNNPHFAVAWKQLLSNTNTNTNTNAFSSINTITEGSGNDSKRGSNGMEGIEGGFVGTFGLTTAEQRHSDYRIQYSRLHECLWNGPSWPYATSVALTALSVHLTRAQQRLLSRQQRQQQQPRRVLFESVSVTGNKSNIRNNENNKIDRHTFNINSNHKEEREEFITSHDYLHHLKVYAQAHRRELDPNESPVSSPSPPSSALSTSTLTTTRAVKSTIASDPVVVDWIDENINPDTGAVGTHCCVMNHALCLCALPHTELCCGELCDVVMCCVGLCSRWLSVLVCNVVRSLEAMKCCKCIDIDNSNAIDFHFFR